tara:strand:+ start:1652 stop:1792 length:141 start_codon:yes stop_codon:yes gene_type:complete
VIKKKIIKIGNGVKIKEMPSKYFNFKLYKKVKHDNRKNNIPIPPKK